MRDKLNQFLVDVLEINFNIRELDRVHSNTMKI